jgi:hypothetical protein
MSTPYFSCSGCTGTDMTTSAMGHVTPKLCFHSVGSVGHVVHCIASEMRNIDALFFMLGWEWYIFKKKRFGTCYA